jgi:hypothetical protein
VIALLSALAAFLGFGLLALSHDRMVDRHEPALGARVSTRLGQLLGGASLLTVGGLSVFEYGWGFGLVAWAGWLAVGALSGVSVLAIAAALRGPLPLVSRRKKYRPNAPDARDMLPR